MSLRQILFALVGMDADVSKVLADEYAVFV
jgi:hypothetical protein